MKQVPIAVFQMSKPEEVHQVHMLTEVWGDQCTYTIIYETPVTNDDYSIERLWCQEHFVGNVWSALVETVQARILLAAPVPVTLIVISAILIDLDDTCHDDNVREWDGEFDPEDDDGSDGEDEFPSTLD